MAEWQTRRTQNPLPARACGFESRSGHVDYPHLVSGEGVQASGAPLQGRYLPALDGLRALAITGVIAFHLGYGWASGGYLGVDLFFVLSGFLITTLLLEEWLQSGAVKLARFWGRRARRLLPALLLMVVVVVVFVATQSGGLPIDWSGLRSQALATVGYAANWQLLATHQTYFDQFTVASPLKHTWSLAIEEQFYLVWPLVIVAMMRLLRRFRRPASWRTVGLVLTAGGAVISAGWMAFLWLNGASVDRVFYGTDTRAFDLLAGAALAMMTVGRPQPSAVSLRRLRFASLAAVAVLAACWATAGVAGNESPRSWMFEGGMALCAVAGAIVIADVRTTKAGTARLSAVAPSRPLYREDLLRPLPVALAGHRRAHSRAHPYDRNGLGSGPGRRHVRARCNELLPRRAAHPARLAGDTPELAASGDGPRRHGCNRNRDPRRDRATCCRNLDRRSAGPDIGNAIGIGPWRRRCRGPTDRPASQHLEAPTSADPLGRGLGDALRRRRRSRRSSRPPASAVVANESQWGYGLTNLPDWAPKLQQWVSQERPDLIVAMWSWDNTAVATDPVGYRADIDRFVQIALNPKDGARGIVFQQFPAPGPDPGAHADQPDYEARAPGAHRWVRRAGRSAPDPVPGRVVYVPIGKFGLLHGQFATWLPPEGRPYAPTSAWIRVRQSTTSTSAPLVPPATRRR